MSAPQPSTTNARTPEEGKLPTIPPPQQRRLKVFSLDPSFDVQLDNTLVSRSVLSVPWEPLTAGPVGEYLEVVDVDPSSGCAYDPVELSDPDLLAQDGLSPSIGNPQFHQQMVYAVAMKTIANFERVLGRQLLWAERRRDDAGSYIKEPTRRYVQRLRIYPHALREQNAYYSPAKAALLFGYFNAPTADPTDELPGGVVFTCLSHDIVAHETTHAILDGMHRRLLDPSNQDMIAFHEAFADIVAIFQHFTVPGLLLDQIQRTRGNLMANNLLARLAAQFARATGQGDALRNALGAFDDKGRRERPDPAVLARTTEPHDRGAILVAAVFDAFVRMYENRVADLRRIATGGTGVLPDGDIHPDLARRFADEAARLAQRVLNMCIRAVDYLPPVDVTFGDFLRAVITADADFYPEDPRRYRLAFVEAFRDRGIYPLDVPALAEDALRWNKLDEQAWMRIREFLPPVSVLRTMAAAYDSTHQMVALLGMDEDTENGSLPEEIWNAFRSKNFQVAAEKFVTAAWQTNENGDASSGSDGRYGRYLIERMFARFLHAWITHKTSGRQLTSEEKQRVGWHLGIDLDLLGQSDVSKRSRLEVHAVRPTVRLRADGRSKVELLIVLAQKTDSELLSEDGGSLSPTGEKLSFQFRGGATLIVDPELGRVTYAISKSLRSQSRKGRTMAFLRDQLAQQGTGSIARFGLTQEERKNRRQLEPFALAHANSIERGVY
jgi:hypothetical protein